MNYIKKFIREKVIGIQIKKIKLLQNEPIMNQMRDEETPSCGCSKMSVKPFEDEDDEKYIMNEED